MGAESPVPCVGATAIGKLFPDWPTVRRSIVHMSSTASSNVSNGRISASVSVGTLAALQKAVDACAAEVVQGMLQQIPLQRRFTVAHAVDKQLFNFKHLGIVHLLFPDAAIVHTTRNFMDVVLSTLRYNFNEAGLGWSFNLREMVEFFALYRRTMAHWEAELPPGRILELRYEDLVGNAAAVRQGMFAFLSLADQDSELGIIDGKPFQSLLTAFFFLVVFFLAILGAPLDPPRTRDRSSRSGPRPGCAPLFHERNTLGPEHRHFEDFYV